MKRTLYFLENEDIRIEITAGFEGGQLVIEGYDIGQFVKEWWGDADYEYSMTLPEESVAELRHILNLNPYARKDLLETLAYKFNGNECFSELQNFFEKQNIKYKHFSWA